MPVDVLDAHARFVGKNLIVVVENLEMPTTGPPPENDDGEELRSSPEEDLILDAVRETPGVKLARLQEQLKQTMGATKTSILAGNLVNRRLLISEGDGYRLRQLKRS